MLAVDPQRRRRGYGSALVKHALRVFGARGAPIGALSTQRSNAPALALYQSLGFVRYGAVVTFRCDLGAQ
jgi:ribosomal protein S18 acetylase RimI-like enzyme